MREVGGGVCVTFNDNTTLNNLTKSIEQVWFSQDRFTRVIPIDHNVFELYTAEVQAKDVGKWFRNVLEYAD